MTRGFDSAWIGVAAIAIAALVGGCRPHASQAPRRDVSGMSVEQIEHELARNREDLEAAGVWVPEPAPATAPPPETPPPEPEQPPPTDDAAPSEAEPDDEVPQTGASPSPEPSPTAERTIVTPGRRRMAREERREAATRCDRICELADVTCDLQAQICGLAERHRHEVRYQAACARAELQCEAAARECELCRE